VDQSHLIRRFKDVYGTTPGSYARESRLALGPSNCD
jgi:AraC-like DNA-binding protein